MNSRWIALIVFVIFSAGCTLNPEAAKKKYVTNGNKYFDKGKYKEALIMYKNAIKKDPRYGEAYYRAALAEIRLLQFLPASRDLHRAIELQPDNLDAYNRLINIYLNAYLADRRRPKQAIEELRQIGEKLRKQSPNSYELVRLNGFLSLADNKPQEALQFFEKANQMKPLEPDIVLVHMQTLMAVGRAADAEKLGYEMIRKQPKAGAVYDALFVHYLREKRNEDAERIIKSKVASNPDEAQFQLQLAAYYYSTQRPPEMAAALQKLTSDVKRYPAARRLAGDFYLRIRDLDSAVAQYEQGAKQFPADKALYLKRMIEAKVLQNKKDEASQILTKLLEEDPKDAEAIAIRASLAMMSGTQQQVQTAINDLQTVVSRMPDNPVVRFNLGRAYLTRGNVQQARIQFEEAVKLRADYMLPRVALAQIALQNREYGKVVQMAQEIFVYDPANVGGKLLRTRALIGMGEVKQARIELADLSQKFPSLWEAKLQLAALDMSEKNYKSAEDIFRQMYSATNDSRAMLGLAEAYVAQDQFKTAMTALEEELTRKPDRLEYRIALGNIAARTEQFHAAEQQFRAVLEKTPRSADVWIRLAETQRRKGDIPAAQQSFHKAKELSPTHVVPLMQLALIHEQLGERDKAKPLYEQILKIQPDNPVALNNLAFLIAEAGGDLDQALTLAQRAKQKMPLDPNVADTLGWIYLKKNLPDSAIPIFRDLVRQKPDIAVYRYHLGAALLQKGDKPQAKRELEAALRDKPARDDETKIRELIARIG